MFGFRPRCESGSFLLNNFSIFEHTLINTYMFVLRKSSNGHESNMIVGESYNYVNKETNSEEFSRAFKSWHGADVPEEDSPETYGYIIYECGSKIMPLYKGDYNYIMTSDGNTFANITFK